MSGTMVNDLLAWVPSPPVLAAVVAVSAILYVVRRLALPRPIPGIPYNKESAGRILGDIPDMTNGSRREWMAQQLIKHKSPIVQLFVRPFTRPAVLISDFREHQDICLRRTKEFDRSIMAKRVFGGVIPEHHITMASSDPRFKSNKELVKDLMTPAFLNEVSAPQIYAAFSMLVELWAQKCEIAGERAFEAGQDISEAALDTITGVTFGLDESHSSVGLQLDHLRSSRVPTSSELDAALDFPRKPLPEELQAFVTLSDSVGLAIQSPLPAYFHWFYRTFSPDMHRAAKLRDDLTRREIDKSVSRLSALGSGDRRRRCAIDDMLLRETARAEKMGREPRYHTKAMSDELFGFLLGGHDTTTSTLSWGVKFLTANQDAQSRLRAALRAAFPEAAAEGRPPSQAELSRVISAGGATGVSYLDAVVEETLRHSRTLPVSTRDVVAPGGATVLGAHLEQGQLIVLATNGSGYMSPAIQVAEELRGGGAKGATGAGARRDWDPHDVTAFRPERWLARSEDGSREVFDAQAGPMASFGLGPRQCFGRRLAYLQLRLAVALLVWNFEFLPVPAALGSFENVEKLTNQPAQCYVRLKRTAF